MSDNLFDYLKWRGDLDMSRLPFSVEDQLILSTLVYVNFHPYIDDDSSTIGKAVARILEHGYDEKNYRVQNDHRLLEMIDHSPRFADLVVSDSVEHFDEKISCQFYAFTVHLPGDRIAICYRGTDLTLAGWKEDFDMAFENVVPSQADALEYLTCVAGKYKKDSLILTGHSKGGNLAVFAAANAPEYVKSRITAVYNNDGPGFNEDSPTKNKLPSIRDKVVTIVPSSSIIGMLMEHTLEYLVVESSSFSIFQHDPYSWVFDGPHFKYADERSKESLLMDRISTSWLKTMSREEREHFVDVVFMVLGAGGVSDFRSYSKQLLQRQGDIIKAYRSLSSNERALLRKIARNFARVAGRTILGMDQDGMKETPQLEG